MQNENLVGKKWLNFDLITILPTNIFAGFFKYRGFFTDKVSTSNKSI